MAGVNAKRDPVPSSFDLGRVRDSVKGTLFGLVGTVPAAWTKPRRVGESLWMLLFTVEKETRQEEVRQWLHGLRSSRA